jgi:hypothetical protein
MGVEGEFYEEGEFFIHNLKERKRCIKRERKERVGK